MNWAFTFISDKLEIPVGLLAAMCSVESNHTNAINWNDAGSPSVGICQMKVKTAKEVGCTASDRLNPPKAVECAGRYLAKQHKRFKSWDKALCYYNTGRPLPSCEYSRKVKGRRMKYIVKKFQIDERVADVR